MCIGPSLLFDSERRLAPSTIPTTLLVHRVQREEAKAAELHHGTRHLQELVDVNVYSHFEREYEMRLGQMADQVTDELLIHVLADVARAGDQLFK